MQCVQCSLKIPMNGQLYVVGDMGPEIVTLLEQSMGPAFNKNGQVCSPCFSSISKLLAESADSDETLSVTSTISIKSEACESDDDCAAPVQRASAVPVQCANDLLVPRTIAVPVQRVNAAKVQHAIDATVQHAIAAPVQRASAVPVQRVFAAPVQRSSAVPVQRTSAVPVQRARVVPVQRVRIVPGKCANAAPVQRARVVPVQRARIVPGKLANAAPVQRAIAVPVQCVSAAPVSDSRACDKSQNGRNCIFRPVTPEQIITNDTSSPPKCQPPKNRIVPDPPEFLRSPMMKRPNNRPLDSNEKTVILNMYKFLERNITTYPFKKDIVKQVAEVTGTSRVTIFRTLSEYKRTGRVRSPLTLKPRKSLVERDPRILSKIKEIVHRFNANNETITTDKIQAAYAEDGNLRKLSRSTMYNVLRKLNVIFEKPKALKKP